MIDPRNISAQIADFCIMHNEIHMDMTLPGFLKELVNQYFTTTGQCNIVKLNMN